jgi:hypothetical protein
MESPQTQNKVLESPQSLIQRLSSSIEELTGHMNKFNTVAGNALGALDGKLSVVERKLSILESKVSLLLELLD